MSSHSDLLSEALTEATNPGDEFEPTELVTAVSCLTDPISAIGDVDRGNALFDAAGRQFGFINVARTMGTPPPPEDMARLAALMRWVMRELCDWRLTSDPKLQKLAAVLVVTRYCDRSGSVWANLPIELQNNTELLATLAKLISGFKIAYSARGLGPVPIWEDEAAEKFKQADADGDWQALCEMWQLFAHTSLPNVLLVHVVQFLDRFGFDQLVGALAGVHQTALAIQVAGSLSVDRRFELALASDNAHIQFGAVMATFYHWPKGEVLSAKQEELLTRLLLKTTNEERRWAQLMKAFNRYPQRYPALQQSLGRALALGPETAGVSYVNGIQLSRTKLSSVPYLDGRGAIANCLRSFRDAATLERRQALWTLAYECWAKWDFGSGEMDGALTEIVGCELDYAIVGYAIECLDKRDVDEARRKIFKEFIDLPKAWHESSVVFQTAVNRLSSRFQPYTQASTILPNVDWLMEGRCFTLYNTRVDHYAALMCGIR